MTDEPRWLTPQDEQLWRRWLRLNTLMPAVLQRDLQADADLSLPDFDVLVQLTDNVEGRVRVSDLARGLNWERSRVSHHIARMERRGLVRREECRDDGRGAWVVLTGAGRTAIEQAAPGHVATVRRVLFDVLSPDEVAAMTAVVDKVLAGLEGQAEQRGC